MPTPEEIARSNEDAKVGRVVLFAAVRAELQASLVHTQTRFERRHEVVPPL